MTPNKYILTAAFLLLIGGFSLANAITPVKAFSETENRYLSKFPTLTKESILNGDFTEKFETYTTDQFPLRDTFISANVLTQQLMGKKDTNGVYFAKDGYLLEKTDQIDREQLGKNTESLQKFLENLENQKISATVMIVPTASYILAEKLPNFATQYDQEALLNTLKNTFGDSFLDLSPTFFSNKKEALYYRTDHHWTTTGAFYAYREFCAKNNLPLRKKETYPISVVDDGFLGTVYSKVQLPNITPDEILQFVPDHSVQITYNAVETSNSLYNPEALITRDKYAYFLKGNNATTKIETGINNGKHILVIKDSFAHCFVPFLTENYETITMVDYRYWNGSTQEVIAQEQITDVLILYNTTNFAEDKDFYKIKG